MLPWQHNNFNFYCTFVQHGKNSPNIIVFNDIINNQFPKYVLDFMSFDLTVKFNVNRFVKCFEMFILRAAVCTYRQEVSGKKLKQQNS